MLVYGSLTGEPIGVGARSALHSCGPPNPRSVLAQLLVPEVR